MGYMDTMTAKERWLATIQMQPVDRLIFWPKLDPAYPPAQDEPFRSMDLRDLQEWIGSDHHEWMPRCVKDVHQNTEFAVTTEKGVCRTVYRTPHGELEQEDHFDEPSRSWHPVKYPVKNLEDLKILTAFYEDLDVALDEQKLEENKARMKELGDTALVCSSIGESALMNWVEWLAGVENGNYMLADHPDEVEAFFEVFHRHLLKKAELLAVHSPADGLYLFENTSTTLISPKQYENYCRPHIVAYGEVCRARDRILVLHMCGHLKALLPRLAGLPAQAFEAFTSPTLGNTTLLDGRTACPDKCLIGGTNAVLWTRTAGEIIAEIEKALDELPHHRGIAVTSAGVMPPLCRPETIREVSAWTKQYRPRMNGG